MNALDFWGIIGAAGTFSDSPKRFLENIEEGLSKWSLSEVLNFSAWLATFLHAAEKRDLEMISNKMTGFPSDDGFLYFRCWLIAQGKEVYDEGLRDPARLLELTDVVGEKGRLPYLESLLYVYLKPFETQSGGVTANDYQKVLPNWSPLQGTDFKRNVRLQIHPVEWNHVGNFLKRLSPLITSWLGADKRRCFHP